MALKIIKTYKRERWVMIVLALIVVVWVLILFVRHRSPSNSPELPAEAVEPPVVTKLYQPKDTATAKPTPKLKKGGKVQKQKTHKQNQQRDHLRETIE